MDLLDSEARPARRRAPSLLWAGPLVAALIIVPDVRHGGLDLLAPADPPGQPASLSLVLDDRPSVVGRTDPALRDGAPWDGQLLLHLEAGTTLLQVSEAARSAAIGPGTDHAWGTLRATLDGLRCTGTFGWRGTTGDPHGSGRVDLGCADGRERSGELRTADRPPAEDTASSGILDLAEPVSP